MNERLSIEQARSVLEKLRRQREGLAQAQDGIASLFPLDASRLESLDVRTSMLVDAFRARFAELQDYLGRRAFAAIARLDEDEDPAHVLSARERVQLMERKGILERRLWQRLRDLRNDFAHEYPDEPAEKLANLNGAWTLTPSLLHIADSAADYLRHAIERSGN